jgi:hypothetical protein
MHRNKNLPQTVEQAVDRLLPDMSLNNEIRLATMKADDLTDLHLSLGNYIRNSFGLWTGNEALLESCCMVSGNQNLHVDDASMVIITELWKKIKTSNVLNNEDSYG